MKDIHKEFNILFKYKLKHIDQAKELKPNKFDNKFKSQFQTVVDNYNTGIKNKNLNAAQRKADEIKDIANRNINKMSKNMDDTALLLENS